MAASVRSNCLPTVHESVATDQSTQTSSASKPGIDSRISSIKPGSNVGTRTQRRTAEEPHIGRYKVSSILSHPFHSTRYAPLIYLLIHLSRI